MLNDIIAAVSTALQDGAISIVRLSGEGCIELISSVFTADLTKKESHTITYGYIFDPVDKQEIDECLVSVFKAPKTFTREDIVEINCHGGKLVTRRVLNVLLSMGARLAEPGEFTKRAFLNGRIDLTQAEAVNDLIQADSSRQIKMAIHAVKGSIRKLLDPILQDLLDLIAHIEVNIDYPEYEDIEQLTNEVVLPMARNLSDKINELVLKSESGRIIKNGVKTVIIGKPNVGKSSLLNALLEEEKAIVTEVAGTTRDLVEGVIHLENITLHLIDTAGIHETEDVVEKIGIEKTRRALDEAELVLVVLDASKELDEDDKGLLDATADKNRILIHNKCDLKEGNEDFCCISASENQIDSLIHEINNRYQKHAEILDGDSLNNDRQIALAYQARQHMNQAIEALEKGFELDLVTIDLQSAYFSLKEILGEASREDLLDSLFSNFCLGK